METEGELRNGGEFPIRVGVTGPVTEESMVYEKRPICFMMEKEFIAEIKTIPAGDMTHAIHDFRDVIDRDRNCNSFTTWKQGLTPKEHFDMAISEQMIVEQRRWQADQAKLADDRHAESMRIATEGVVAANRGVVTANNGARLSAGSAILAALIAAGVSLWPSKPVPTIAPIVNVVIPEQKTPPIIAEPIVEPKPAIEHKAEPVKVDKPAGATKQVGESNEHKTIPPGK